MTSSPTSYALSIPPLPRWEHWARPSTRAFRPTTLGELQELLRHADREATPVHLLGGGHHTRSLPDLDAVVLDMRDLRRVTEWDADSLILTAEAGATRAELEMYAAGRSASLVTWRREHPTATVGGMLSAYRPGPVGLWDGSVQSQCLGLGVFTAQGDTYRYTPAPRKASGPDLRHAFFGAEGTLGVVAFASLSVAPIPERSVAFCVEDLGFGEALTFLRALTRAGFATPNMMYSGAGQAFWCALEGTRLWVDLMISTLQEVAGDQNVEVSERDLSLYYRPAQGDIRQGADPCVTRAEDPHGAVAFWSTLCALESFPEELAASCVVYDITAHTASLWCPMHTLEGQGGGWEHAAAVRSVWFVSCESLESFAPTMPSASALKRSLDPRGIFPPKTPWGARRAFQTSSDAKAST